MISACALIAFQSAKATGASKFAILPDVRRARDLAEEAGPGQVVDHDLGDPRRQVRRRGAVRHEAGRGEGHRLDHPLGDLDPERRLRRGGKGREHQGRGHAEEEIAAEPVYHDTIPSGLKTTSMLRHCPYFSRGSS